MPRHPSQLVVVFVVVVGAVACATDEARVVGWDDAVEATHQAKQRSTTPEEYAAEAESFISPSECEKTARERFGVDKKDGAKLMKGCVARHDFTSVMMLSTPPWNALKFNEKEYGVLLEIAMRRGGTQVAEDFRQLGIEVDPWELFRQLPADEQPGGRLVELRVLVLSQTTKKNGAVEAKVRVYGTGGVKKVYDTFSSGGFSSSRSRPAIGGFSGSAGREAKEVKPIGSTVVVRSPKPLPTDRRVHMLARYNDDASRRLRKENEAREEPALMEGMTTVKIDDRDPLEEAVLDVIVVANGSALAGSDLEGVKR